MYILQLFLIIQPVLLPGALPFLGTFICDRNRNNALNSRLAQQSSIVFTGQHLHFFGVMFITLLHLTTTVRREFP
jgi:hypothetical protein